MRLFFLCMVLSLVGCCHQSSTEFERIRFAVRPFGELLPLADSKPQKVAGRQPVKQVNFVEITLAQGGAGQGGFDSVRLFRNGSGYAVAYSEQRRQGVKIRFQLNDVERRQLIEAMGMDRIHLVPQSVASDLHDGAVGFVQIVTTDGSARCRMSNYFEPVAHLYPLCNTLVWNRVIIGGKLNGPTQRVDGMTEYCRVFGTD